ncbi:MAG: phage portal protein [Lachnospiraceae bacterium]|nr:phage portal protein [Lachnospiraceae bacterium]
MSSEIASLGYLRNKLSEKCKKVKKRYAFYEMKNSVPDFRISTPPRLRNMVSILGWCGKAVDSLADRLVFREMRGDDFGTNEIFRMNNPDVLFDSAVLSALISSCCFVYISPDENGKPRLQVIDGGSATGVIDPITGMLKTGYAVLERDRKTGAPTAEAYFTPGTTTYVYASGEQRQYNYPISQTLLVPIVYRPDAVRPFGRSVISRACMSLVASACRTVKRTEISAEFFSFPQKYIVGLSEDAEIADKWSASMSTLLTISEGENGEKPTLGQFAQQSMSPHNEQLKTLASLFAGETGLTVEDMGFSSGNPASQEAIKAAHENLRLKARKAQRCFGSGFLNVAYVAACLRDEHDYKRSAFAEVKPIWEPIFEPDSAMLSGIGDGAIKINQAVPGYFTEENLRDLTGIEKR